MSIVERLAILVDLNTDDAVRAMGRLEDSAKRSLEDGVEARLDRTGETLTRVGGAMMGVGAAAAVGLVMAADKTRQLEDQTARAEQTFGAAFTTLQDEAENAVNTLGISERAFLDANSSIGVFGRGAGMAGSELAEFTTGVVDVTRDLASFTGASFEEGIDAIGAAFRGEFDSVERFGIQLNETKIQAEAADRGLGRLEKGSREYLELVRDLIFEQAEATGALGDYERTSDSATNTQQRLNAQWENFQAQLGEGVLPIMTQVLDTGGRMLGFVNDLDEDTGGMVSTVGTWTTGLLLAGGAVSTTIGQVIKFRDNIRTATTALNNHKAAAAGAVGAIALLTTAYLEYRQRQEAGETQAAAFDATLESTGDKAASAAAALESLKEQFPDLTGAMADAGVTAAELESAMLAGGDELEDVLLRLVDGGTLLAGSNESFSRTLVNVSNDMRDTIESASALGDAFDRIARWADEAAAAHSENYTPAVDDAAEATTELEDAIDDAKEAHSEFVDQINQRQRDIIGLREAQREVNEKVTEYYKTLNDEKATEQDKQRATDDLVLSMLDAAEKYAEVEQASGDMRDENDLQIESLEGVANYLTGPAADAILGHIWLLGQIPTTIHTRVILEMPEGSSQRNVLETGDPGRVGASPRVDPTAGYRPGRSGSYLTDVYLGLRRPGTFGFGDTGSSIYDRPGTDEFIPPPGVGGYGGVGGGGYNPTNVTLMGQVFDADTVHKLLLELQSRNGYIAGVKVERAVQVS